MKTDTPPPRPTPQDLPESSELRPERIGAKLRPERIGALARELPAWRVADDDSLLRTWSFPDGRSAACFAGFVAALGEALGHPPVVRQHGPRVTVRVSSPHAGGLTGDDVDLARRLGAAG